MLDAAGLGAGPIEADADRGRALERHLPDPPRRRALRAAPPAATAAAALGPRRSARGATARRARRHRRPRAPRAARARGRVRPRRAVLRDGRRGRRRLPRRAAARARHARPSAAGSARSSSTRWPSSTPSRLPRASAGRPATSSASCAASPGSGSCRARASCRSSRRCTAGSRRPCPSRRPRPSSTATTGSVTRCTRPAAPGPPARDPRLGARHGRRPARRRRLPDRDLDRARRALAARHLPGHGARRASRRRDDLVARYEEVSGRRVERLAWYQALALWKASIFLEGNYSRFLAGTTDDPYYAKLDTGVPALAEAAWELASAAG